MSNVYPDDTGGDSAGAVSDNLIEALRCANRGWPVLPLHSVSSAGCSCGQAGCTSVGKHPRTRHGVKDATIDRARIVDWWSRWPDANLGVATGAVPGLLVVDIDPRNHGDDALDALEEQYGRLPDTVEVLTGGGGRHIYFRYPPGVAIRCPVLAQGIDIKGSGGYVVAPPSLHASGRKYEFEVSLEPDEVALADAPDWLVARLAPDMGSSRTRPPIDVAAVLNGVQKGERNQRLFEYACSLRAESVPRETAKTLLLHAASACQPPLPAVEAERVLDSAWRYPEGPSDAAAPSSPDDPLNRALVLVKQAEPGDLDWVYSDEAMGIWSALEDGDRGDQLDAVAGVMRKRGWSSRDVSALLAAVRSHRDQGPLQFYGIRQVIQRVDEMEDPGWIARPVWPGDAYGVIAAESKAGKTWAALDLAVSVAAGGSWMGHYDCSPARPVLLCLGEGGERNTVRRLKAICVHKGAVLEDLSLRMVFRVPHLNNPAHLSAVGQEIADHHPALVIVDPLYLAAPTARGSSLYDMAEPLSAVQDLAQGGGAALTIVHHYNQSGRGKGASRMSGAGPEEWGRVLATADLNPKKPGIDPDGASVVGLDWTFTGSEIGYQTLRVRRRVRAEDPHDLTSEMHYEVEVVDSPEAFLDLKPSAVLTLVVLERDQWTTAEEAQDRVAELRKKNGESPYRKRTIQDALQGLAEAGFVERESDGRGVALRWRLKPRDGSSAPHADPLRTHAHPST